MRIGLRAGVVALALAASLVACGRGGGEGAGGGAASAKQAEQARADSARNEEKMLRDSGVTVDTQTVDTGAAAAPPAEDN